MLVKILIFADITNKIIAYDING